MWRRRLITIGIIAAFGGGFVAINNMQPGRVSEEREAEADEVQEQIEKAEQVEAELIAKAAVEEEAAAVEEAQELDGPFLVELECSNGTIVVELHPEWAPIGVRRFKRAVEEGVYDEARFFRVIPGFVVQFGIPGDPEIAQKWMDNGIQDEPVLESNARGTLTFAKSSAPNSRTTQMFINLGDNTNLDRMGFSAIGKVVKGMEIVDAITPEYGESPDQGMIQSRGNAYLKEYFPNLDFVKKATILTDSEQN